MPAVTLLHLGAIAWVLYHPIAPVSPMPMLSFTVTMTAEPSSAPSSVSSASSAASTAATEKPEPQKDTQTQLAKAASGQQAIKKASQPVPRVKADQSHNSREQTAVLAPLTPARFDAAYLNNPAPEYPWLSRRMGEQGRVLLSVYVNEQGKAGDISIRQSSGYSRLDNAAVDSVRKWRFAAARQGEKMVASWVQVPVKFVLE